MTEKIRIIYAGYDFFAPCLHWLSKSNDVVLVACMTGTNTDPIGAVRSIAEENRLPIFFGSPTPSVISRLNEFGADILLSAAYSYRLPVEDIDVKHALNLHSSLLPEGRGPNPLPYVLAGRSPAGVTLHKMVEEFDTGPIVSRLTLDIGPEDGFDELALKCAAAAVRLVSSLVNIYPRLPVTPQGEGTYWPPPNLSDRTVDVRIAHSADVVQVRRRFGESGILVQISDDIAYRSGEVVTTCCEHPFGVGEVVARASDSVMLAMVDGLLKLRRPERVRL